MAGKLGYKFVNPALTGDEKTAVDSAGIPQANLPHRKVLLGLNRAGATTNSIYNIVKSMKGLEEVRAISLKDDEVDQRRAIRRKKDQAAEDRQEAPLTSQDEDKIKKDGAKEIKKDKKKTGILQKIFGPLLDVISPFIKFAAIYSTLKWFSDPKNLEKVERLVEFAGEVFKFLFQWASFGVTNLLDGLGKVFGGVNKFKEGNILGGAWDSIMGLGQLLMGLVALKGLALFLNPWKLMGGILDMLNVLGDDADSGGGDCGPDLPDGKPNKPKGRRPKGRLQKLVQRSRIALKRLRRFFRPLIRKAVAMLAGLAAKMGTKVFAVAAKIASDIGKPLVKTVTEVVTKALPEGAIDQVAKQGKNLQKGLTNLGAFASNQAGRFRNFIGDFAKGAVDKGKNMFAAAANRWKEIKSGAIELGQKAMKTAKGWGDNIVKGAVALKDKGTKAVVDNILSPLRSQADDLIKKSPILQKLMSLFKGAGKQGIGDVASAAFKKFIDFVKPIAEPLGRKLKALNLPVIDTVIEGLFALYDLKSGVPPVRVALRLGGSLAGLALGTALTGSAAFFSGGMGAFLAPVLIGVTQWGGEWLADRLADAMGIPQNNNDKKNVPGFWMGGVITDRAMIEVAEKGPEVVAPLEWFKNLINPMTSVLPGAPMLVGAMASFIDSVGQFPGVSSVKGELNTAANVFGAAGFSVPKDETIKQPTFSVPDDKASAANGMFGGIPFLESLMGMFGGGSEEPKKTEGKTDGGGTTSTSTSSSGGGDTSSSNLTLTNTDYLKLMVETMNKGGISNKNERTMFMAQVGHESGEGRYMEEIASGAAYEGRSDLGNTQPGDGKKFKGRGYIQITGRANYKRYGPMIGVPDAVENPKKLAQPQNAAKVALAYWKDRVNRGAAQKGMDGMRTVTRNINGGLNGLQDRIAKFKKYSGMQEIQKASLGGAIKLASGGIVNKRMVVIPSFSAGGAVDYDSMTTDQLKGMLDPTMPGARNPAVFAAASEARRKYRTLGRAERERRVLVATVKAMKGATPPPKITSPTSGPAPGSALRQSSAAVAKEVAIEDETPAVVPIPSLTPVPINNVQRTSAPSPVYVNVGKTGMQKRFSGY